MPKPKVTYKIWDGDPPSTPEDFVKECPEYPLELVQWYFHNFVMERGEDWTNEDLLEFLLINGPVRLKKIKDSFGPIG